MTDREVSANEVPTTSSRSAAATAGMPVVLQGSVPLPPKLKMGGDIRSAWRQIWDSYEIVSRLAAQTDDYRVATFITCIGAEALDVYKTEEDKTNMETVLRLMEAHCIGETNTIYERFHFQRRQQEPGERVEQFVTALRALAKACNFGGALDERVRDQIVFGVRENDLRKQLLQRRDLTVSMCVDMCRASKLRQSS